MAEQSAALRQLLCELRQRSQTAASIGSASWTAASRAFRGETFDAWADALANLISQNLNSDAVAGFIDSSSACADAVGAQSALQLATTLLTVWRVAGSRPAEALLNAAPI